MAAPGLDLLKPRNGEDAHVGSGTQFLSSTGCSHRFGVHKVGNRASRAGLGRANSGLGQNRARPKLAWFFRAKILVAQPALKTGLVGPNSLLKVKKIRADRAR